MRSYVTLEMYSNSANLKTKPREWRRTDTWEHASQNASILSSCCSSSVLPLLLLLSSLILTNFARPSKASAMAERGVTAAIITDGHIHTYKKREEDLGYILINHSVRGDLRFFHKWWYKHHSFKKRSEESMKLEMWKDKMSSNYEGAFSFQTQDLSTASFSRKFLLRAILTWTLLLLGPVLLVFYWALPRYGPLMNYHVFPVWVGPFYHKPFYILTTRWIGKSLKESVWLQERKVKERENAI